MSAALMILKVGANLGIRTFNLGIRTFDMRETSIKVKTI